MPAKVNTEEYTYGIHLGHDIWHPASYRFTWMYLLEVESNGRAQQGLQLNSLEQKYHNLCQSKPTLARASWCF